MTTKQHLKKHDEEIAAIRKLILGGMRLVGKVQEVQARTAKNLTRLEEAQTRTEANLQNLIETLRRGGNGHSKRKLDIQ